ncbi:MAG: hypothetical protein A3F87_01140 [Omnitrophica WOR_2 bacterium RIFCSPLOWO2_12_FULL_51_24]|nr:MAG: hypothetical protein A2879_04870 [Omnitrophica WOR_2 bacterium RIFCSPHIGHO2_01_FULL_49_10]OGX34060.1 MAG: hypothetical protein A3I43_03675 [Omnitrophica WOR_2 bacterium RIFCSPLOWO2_02_FULL_50_19]OGX43916.1 MAG: hypothetical protein A3F87_01140 [Omnitrophica WOR_2 bacterium RIFCSPLOWO2_12_FULL_51_24]
MKKLALLVLAIIVISCIVVGSARAEEQENSFVNFWRGVFHWPFNAAKNSAQVIGDTGVKAVNTVADEGKAIGGTLTGQEGAAEDLVTNPVTGTAETVKTGVVGAAEMPGKSTQESWPDEKK